MRTAVSLVKGSVFRTVDLLTAVCASLWLTPIIVHALGNRMYGFWTLLGVFLGYYGLLDFGLTSAAGRYISQSLGKGDIEDLNGVANTACFLFCLIGAAALLVTAACVLACPFFIRDPADLALFKKILVLLGVVTALGFPSRVFDGILTSYLRYDVMSYISIGRTVASTIAIYVVLGRGGGIMSVAVISGVSNLVDYAASWAVCSALYPDIILAPLRYDRGRIRLMFDHGWKNFAAAISDIVRFRIDSVLVAAFLSVNLVTFYAIGARLVEGFNKLVNSSIGMMLPVFSRYDGLGNHDAIRDGLLKVTKLSSLLSAYIGISVIFYAKPLILRWMGLGFESSYGVAAILSFAFMIELPASPGIQLLYGLSKHDSYAVLNAVEAALNFVLSVVLLRFYGMYGVVLGTAIEVVLIKLFVLPIYICRAARVPYRVFVVDTVLLTLAKTAVLLAACFYAIKPFVLPNYLRLIECVAAQTLVFVPAAYFFVLSADERRFIRGLATALGDRGGLRKPRGVNAAV